MKTQMTLRKFYGIFLFCAFLCWSCDSPDANNCLKTVGDEVERVVDLPIFDRLLVNRDVEAFIVQGAVYEARIVTGDNLLNDITAEVIDGQLIVTNGNTCNWVRAYEVTKVYVTVPNLKEIRTSTQFDISSVGVLNYPDLTLLSEDFNAPGAFAIGDFNLEIQSQKLRVVSNNISSFHIQGSAEVLEVEFYGGLGRFEGPNLISNEVTVFHRGSNDMVLNPQQSIRGSLRGPGDVIALNRPDVVEVEEIYTGRLIFRD
jgi:hypothetical protein